MDLWEDLEKLTNYLIPLLLLAVSLTALHKKENAYAVMLDGAADGLKLLKSILPPLVLLMTAVSMLRQSGAMELLSRFLSPLLDKTGIPAQTAVLLLIRPISGSAALAVGSQLMATYGPDSRIGLTTAVMLGSTETTFYTISVYFGAAGIRKTRYTVPAALAADLMGFLCASWSIWLLFPEAR